MISFDWTAWHDTKVLEIDNSLKVLEQNGDIRHHKHLLLERDQDRYERESALGIIDEQEYVYMVKSDLEHQKKHHFNFHSKIFGIRNYDNQLEFMNEFIVGWLMT